MDQNPVVLVQPKYLIGQAIDDEPPRYPNRQIDD
jgi:hypothetical protein